MNYYWLLSSSENKVWKKYIIFRYEFLYNNEDIKIKKIVESKNNIILENLYIQALREGGNVEKEQSFFEKQKLANFIKVDGNYLIKEDVFEEKLFENINGSKYFIVKLMEIL